MGQSLSKKTVSAQINHQEVSSDFSSDNDDERDHVSGREQHKNANSSKQIGRKILARFARRSRETAPKATKCHGTEDKERKVEETDFNKIEKNLVEVPMRAEASRSINDGTECLNHPTNFEMSKSDGSCHLKKYTERNDDLTRIQTFGDNCVGTALNDIKSSEDALGVQHKSIIPTPNSIPTTETRQHVEVIVDFFNSPDVKIVSTCHQEEVFAEEKVLLETQLQQLEIPIKWLSAYNDEKASAEDGGGDVTAGTNREVKGKSWRQDHFRTATYRLWQSARFCLDSSDYDKALRELSQAKGALKRFAEAIDKRVRSDDISEAQRGDVDVVKSMNMVITGTIAHISFQMAKYNDVKRLLHAIGTESVSHGSEAAMKGIQASTLAHSQTAVHAAVKAAKEAALMDPKYWRWHALLSVLLQRLPEPNDPLERMTQSEEIFSELETVYQLEKNAANRALLLGDAYRSAVFQVRNRKDSVENYKEYARLAMHAYMAAIDRAPQCALTHARAARSLWGLRRQHNEAHQKALWTADRAMAILLGGEDFDDEYDDEDEMEKKAEAAMILGLLWESMGKIDRALVFLRMAANNPSAQPHIAYRAELGIIVGSYQLEKAGKKNDSRLKTNILVLLDKLMEKFKDSYLQQQILCHKGQYLMDVKKNNSAALEAFNEAISINPHSMFLKKFYPRFCSTFVHPVRVSDLVHELACKELTTILVRAKKGSPEAVKRSDFLNECIQRAKDSEIPEGTTLSKNDEQFKPEKDSAASEIYKGKSVYCDELDENKRENDDGKDAKLSETLGCPNNIGKSGKVNDSSMSEKELSNEKPLIVFDLAEYQKKPDEYEGSKDQNKEEFRKSDEDNLEIIEQIVDPMKVEGDGKNNIGERDVFDSEEVAIAEKKGGKCDRGEKADNDVGNVYGKGNAIGINKGQREESTGKSENLNGEGKCNKEGHYKSGSDAIVVDMIEKRERDGGFEGGRCISLCGLAKKLETDV